MKRSKPNTNINQLLQPIAEDSQQAVTGGAIYLKVDGIVGERSSAEASTSAPYQGKRSTGGYVPT